MSAPPARRLAAEWRRTAAILAAGEVATLEEAVHELDAAELEEPLHGDKSVDAVLRLLTGLCAEVRGR